MMNIKFRDPRRQLKAEKWAWSFCYDTKLLPNLEYGGLYDKYLCISEALSDLTAAQRVTFCLFVQEAETPK